MNAGRALGIVFALLGIGAIGAAIYAWNVVEDQIPLLNQIDAASRPEFGFSSVDEWRSLALRRVALWGAFGVTSVVCGIGLLLSPYRSNLALYGAVTILALFVLLVVFAPWLWTEFIGFPAMTLGIYSLRYSARATHA